MIEKNKSKTSKVTNPLVVSVGLISLSSMLAFLSVMFWNSKAENKELQKRIVKLETDQAVISSAIVPISAAFQAALIKQLTHLGTPELDALLVKVGPPYTLTHDEEKRIVVLLQERAELAGTLLTNSERNAARMLPMVIQRVQSELALGIGDKNKQDKVKKVVIGINADTEPSKDARPSTDSASADSASKE